MVGHIKLDRKILKWEWYDDANTFRLFIHLLLTANYKDKQWHGINICRGQVLSGRIKLAQALHLTEMQIRYSLDRLKSTNEITIKTTNKYSLITICKYDIYQNSFNENIQQQNQQQPQPITNQQPTSNQQITTTNKDNNINKDNNGKNIIISAEEKNWRIEVSKFLKDDKFKKDFVNAYGISYEDLSRKMNDFVVDVNLKMDYKNVAALKRHFTNHFKKHKEEILLKYNSNLGSFNEVPENFDYEKDMVSW